MYNGTENSILYEYASQKHGNEKAKKDLGSGMGVCSSVEEHMLSL
jgi:hypothetical protein